MSYLCCFGWDPVSSHINNPCMLLVTCMCVTCTLNHCLKADLLIGGRGSLSSGINTITFWAHSSNSLSEGLCLPIEACKMIKECLMTSFCALLDSLVSALMQHSLTERGTIKFNFLPRSSKFSVPSGLFVIEEANVASGLECFCFCWKPKNYYLCFTFCTILSSLREKCGN